MLPLSTKEPGEGESISRDARTEEDLVLVFCFIAGRRRGHRFSKRRENAQNGCSGGTRRRGFPKIGGESRCCHYCPDRESYSSRLKAVEVQFGGKWRCVEKILKPGLFMSAQAESTAGTGPTWLHASSLAIRICLFMSRISSVRAARGPLSFFATEFGCSEATG